MTFNPRIGGIGVGTHDKLYYVVVFNLALGFYIRDDLKIYIFIYIGDYHILKRFLSEFLTNIDTDHAKYKLMSFS